jgi:hypothetical protein
VVCNSVVDISVVESDVPSREAADDETNPVPVINTAVSLAPAVMAVGEMDVTLGAGLATEIVADPDFDVSSVEVAVTVAVPPALGAKIPVLLTVPMPEGLTDHVTAEL